MKLRPTRFGLQALLFEVVMLAAFYAAPYSNLFFLLLAFLTLLLATGTFSAVRNLRGVRAALDDLPPVPSGTPVVLTGRLEAPGGARFGVSARIELEGGACLEGRVDLLEGAAPLRLDAPALPRGLHAVLRTSVETSHPFGLLRVVRAVDGPRELVVYPSPRGVLEGRSASSVLDELLGRSDPGAGDLQPTGLRDHRTEDGVRGIHLRASARRGALVVLEWEGGSGQGLEVLLDRRCAPVELEEALAGLSALVELARTSKESLRIQSQGLSATFGAGHRPWSEVLRFLAAAEVLPAEGPEPPPVSPAVARFPRGGPRVAAREGR